MSMIPFRSRKDQLPAVPASLAHVSRETAQYFQRAAEIEAECEELRETVARLKAEIDDVQARHRATEAEFRREVAFERRKRQEAEAERDYAKVRCTQAETSLFNACTILADQAERTRALGSMDPPRGNEGATDLDEAAATIPGFLKQGPQEGQT